MKADPDRDALLQLVRQANALDPRRPSERVDAAVRAQARMLAQEQGTGAPLADPVGVSDAAANAPRWKLSMLASVAVLGFVGLLVLQFDRGTPQEKDVVRGQSVPGLAVPAAPSPAPEPEPAPAAKSASTRARVEQALPLADKAALAKKQVDTMPQADAGLAAAAGAPTLKSQSRAEASTHASEMAPPAPAGAGAAPMSGQRGAVAGASAVPAPSRRDQAIATVPPLLVAAREGRTQQVDALIAAGSPIDVRDHAGRTALMLAAMQGHLETVRKLLAAGADTRLVDNDTSDAAQLARQHGHAQVARLIESGR